MDYIGYRSTDQHGDLCREGSTHSIEIHMDCVGFRSTDKHGNPQYVGNVVYN